MDTTTILINFLAIAQERVAKEILRDAQSQLVRRLSEIAYNCLFTDLQLSRATLKKVHRYRKKILLLADKRISYQEKRLILKKLPVKYIQHLVKITLPFITS